MPSLPRLARMAVVITGVWMAMGGLTLLARVDGHAGDEARASSISSRSGTTLRCASGAAGR